MVAQWNAINNSYKDLDGYKRVAWPPASEERIVREFTPQPQSQYPADQMCNQQQPSQQSNQLSDAPVSQQNPHQQHQSSPRYFYDQTAPYNNARESNPHYSQNVPHTNAGTNLSFEEKPIVLVDKHFSKQPYWNQISPAENQAPGYAQRPIYQQQFNNPSNNESQRQLPYRQQEPLYAPNQQSNGYRESPNSSMQQEHFYHNNQREEYPSQNLQQSFTKPHQQNQVPSQTPYQQPYQQPYQKPYQQPNQQPYQQPDQQPNQFQQPRWIQQQHLPQPYKVPNQQDQYQAHQHPPQPYKVPNQQEQLHQQHQAPFYQTEQYQQIQPENSLTNQQQVPYPHHQALSRNQYGSQPNQEFNSFSQPQQPYPVAHDQTDKIIQAHYNEQRGGSPGIITLRKEAPVSQASAPVYASQPAAVSYQGGSKLRGDLKWPPPECKETMARENEERRQLALGPACRPRKVKRDFTAFFAKNALNHHYPGYKVPPGTQHIY